MVIMKKRLLLIYMILFSLLLTAAGCSTKSEAKGVGEEDSISYTFVDSKGRQVVLQKAPEKVVALQGSYAEAWILAGGNLVGATEDAISERELDLGENVSVVGSVKEPNLEEIIHLDPDFIILSEDIASHEETAEVLEQAGIATAFFKVELFEDYLKMLDVFTDLTGKKENYQSYGVKIEEQIEEILTKAGKVKEEPKILFLRAFSKKITAKKDDNQTGRILADLHTDNIASRHDSLLEDLSMEDIIMEDPDYIFVTTMGKEEEALKAFYARTESDPAWNNLKAVKENHLYILPKELFHYKPNDRWGDSYEYLAKILYPEQFPE